MNIDELIKEIREFIENSGVNRKRLADMAGIDHTVIVNILRPEWNPTAKTLRALCNAIRTYRIGVE